MNERFALFLKTKGLTIRKTAELLGKSEQYVRKLTTSGGSFGIEPLKAISAVFSDINTDWLLTGNGEMLKSEILQTAPFSIELVESQQRTIETLSRTIENLSKR